MKRKILWIVDKYLPNPSSNGACVSKLTTVIENPEDCYVLSVLGKNEEKQKNTDNLIYCRYDRRPSTYFSRLFGYAEDKKMVDALFEETCLAIEKNKIDTVVCVFRPIENILVGLRIKEKYGDAVKVVAYFLDNIAEVSSNSVWKAAILGFNQKRILKRVNSIFDRLVALKYYWKMDEYLAGKGNIRYVGLPNLVKPKTNIGKEEKNGINLVYAGSFYDGFREPESILTFMNKVSGILPELTVHLYSWGCEEQVEKMKNLMGDKLVLHGRVSSKEALHAMEEADCLLNVGNDLPHQVPGKLVEYFATGKPVIGFIYRKDDPAMEDYKKYGNMFMVRRGGENSEELCAEFIRNAHIKPWDEIRTSFKDCLPAFTIDAILSEKGEKYV